MGGGRCQGRKGWIDAGAAPRGELGFASSTEPKRRERTERNTEFPSQIMCSTYIRVSAAYFLRHLFPSHSTELHLQALLFYCPDLLIIIPKVAPIDVSEDSATPSFGLGRTTDSSHLNLCNFCPFVSNPGKGISLGLRCLRLGAKRREVTSLREECNKGGEREGGKIK